MKFRFVSTCSIALLLSALLASAAKAPNIMIILGDDMGFSDISCYGSEISTPNLNKLASEGVRFTQFYNNCRCCPTRASILTGLYPHEAGVGHMTGDQGYDGYRGQLNRQCVTIPEVLRTSGYHTYMCGKWHVCRDIRPNGDKSDWPIQRGFEKFYGTITGAGSYYDPTTLCRQNTYITPQNDPEYKTDDYYYTDAIADNVIQFLKQHEAGADKKPFFFYVAFTAAHWPMQARERDIAKYKGKYDGGYEATRKSRFEREKALGLIKPEWQLSPQAGDWGAVANKAREARRMEVYAAMVECMDRGVGRIVEQLRQSGELDNTLILFLQDNGGCAEDMEWLKKAPAPADLKPYGPNDLQAHIWPPMQTRDGRWVRFDADVMPGGPDTYIAYGRNWANVSDTPFREYKHWVHEGGISTPLIAHWPNGIKSSRNGKLETQPGHIVDLMATCVNLSKAKYPTEREGEKIKAMEGVPLTAAFNGKPLGRKQPIFWEHEGNRAVRQSNWKLVAKENQPWELYDMEKDRSEMNNLAASNPGKVKELAGAWEAYAARADVLPYGAWHGKKGSAGKKKNREQANGE